MKKKIFKILFQWLIFSGKTPVSPSLPEPSFHAFDQNIALSMMVNETSPCQGRQDSTIEACISLRGGVSDENADSEATISDNNEQRLEPVDSPSVLLSGMNTSKDVSSASNHTKTNGKGIKPFPPIKEKLKKLFPSLQNSESAAMADDLIGNSFEINNDDDEVTYQSDLMRPGRKIFVVTTAAIPWFTGTAVNPLLRAAYLFRLTKEINENETYFGNDAKQAPARMVTLVIPWLELEEDRLEVYGQKHQFSNSAEQEVYIRNWLRDKAEMPKEADSEVGLQIMFYPARYHPGLKSIFAMGDIPSLIPDSDADVCMLEEPEHLNWFRAPEDGWRKKFNFVVGIIHTNYVEYASSHFSGLWTAPAIRAMSSAMVRAYCHVVIKLSDTLQTFAEEKERTTNVHGVRSDFLKIGRMRANIYNAQKEQSQSRPLKRSRKNICGDNLSPTLSSEKKTTTKTYFIGKILWTKGLDKMLEMESFYKHCKGSYFPIDIFGNGPEEKEIIRAYHGRRKYQKKNSKSSDNNSELSSVDDETGVEILDDKSNDLHEKEEEVESGKENIPFAEHVSRISKQIQSTSKTIKLTTESLELDFPKTIHELRKDPIPATFPGRVDHATLSEYDIFVNPSLSEVLCTTTAEALAMGKFVIIPDHPSNRFFMQFPNTLQYRNKFEFVANLEWALSRQPAPLTPDEQQIFTWEAATKRLVKASAITYREARERQQRGTSKRDERIAWFHNEVGKGALGDALRRILGAAILNDVERDIEDKAELSDANEEEHDDGLRKKFIGSSLATAIQKTLKNGMISSPGINF